MLSFCQCKGRIKKGIVRGVRKSFSPPVFPQIRAIFSVLIIKYTVKQGRLK